MRLRRFSGATVAEALRRVKAALGPEAVILETLATPGAVTVTAATDDETPRERSDDLAQEVRRLLAAVHDLVDERWARALPGALRALHRALLAQGVDGVIAAALVRETAARFAPATGLDAALAGTLEAQSTLPAVRVRLFVGPPGDGKTTTIAKLAAHEVAAGRRVALVTTDTYRVGGAAELGAYARALDVPLGVATNGAELAAALAAAGDAEVVLVDTFGAGASGELAALVGAAGPAAGRTLVVSAVAGAAAAARTWEAFAPLRPDACVLTKLDLAPGGAMLGQCWQRRVPVTHVAAGRGIPDDLERATPDRLARCLLAA